VIASEWFPNREELLGPPTLGWEGGLPHGRLTAELARLPLVCSVLMKGLTKLKFAILRLGATIYDGGKSERSILTESHDVFPCSISVVISPE